MRLPRFTPLLFLAALAGTPPAARGDGLDLDPALQALLARGDRSPGSLSAATPGGPLPRTLTVPAGEGGGELELFLRTAGRDLEPADGLTLFPLGDGRYAARADLAALRRLLEGGNLVSARLARPVRFALDRSGAYLGISRVRRADLEVGGFRGATGRGVVVGTVDSGVDWTHPDFQRPDGSTRLNRYWDQLGIGGGSPARYPIGVEYTDRLINLGIVSGMDIYGHGTHVLGIAAGNGRASFFPGVGALYAGIAPEATLIAVRTNFTEFGVVLGVRYLFERADALGMPAVVNLSLGNHFGPHRGTTPFEEALADLVAPGKLIVAAAGNDAAEDFHAEMRPDDSGPGALEIGVPAYDKGARTHPYAGVEGWFDRRDRFRFTVENPEGAEVGSFVVGDQERTLVNPRGVILGWCVEDLGMATFFVEIEDNPASARLSTGTWRVRLEPLERGGDGEVDFWMVGGGGFRDGAVPRFLTHVDPGESVISPATAPALFAVGAMVTRDCWMNARGESTCYAAPPPLGEPAYFSSLGPTPDGRLKPEILAPGFGVVSARSSGISSAVASTEELDRLSTPDRRYYVSQGTSMAAPQVTGTTALLLARFPRLTVEQLRHRLAGRALVIPDSRTGGSAPSLQVAAALAPSVTVSLADVVPDPRGLVVRWFAGKEREPVEFRVYKGLTDSGPYLRLVSRLVSDRPSYEALDRHPQPGLTQIYRIAAVDTSGLEEDLDTLRVAVPGVPAFVFRAPDPNPARDPVSLRFYIPPSAAGGRFEVDIFDARGRRVIAAEAGEFSPAGEDRVARWDLRDGGGTRVAGGVYFVRIGIAFIGGEAREAVRRVVVLP